MLNLSIGFGVHLTRRYCLCLALFSALGADLASAQYKQRNRTKTTRGKNYAKPQKSAQTISGQFLVNYFGSGLGLAYQRPINSYFSWGGSTSYTQAHLEGKTQNNVKEVVDTSMIRFAAQTRFHFLNYFYLGASLNLSQVSGNYSLVESSAGNTVANVSLKSIEVYPDLFIGTQWQLRKNFVLSIDWLGSGLSTYSSLNTNESANASETVGFITGYSPDDRIANEIKEQLSLYYMVVSLGIRI